MKVSRAGGWLPATWAAGVRVRPGADGPHLAGSPGPAPAGGARAENDKGNQVTRLPGAPGARPQRQRPSLSCRCQGTWPVRTVRSNPARGGRGGRLGAPACRSLSPALAEYPFRLIVRSPYSQKCLCLRSGLYWLGIKSESAGVKQVVPAQISSFPQ